MAVGIDIHLVGLVDAVAVVVQPVADLRAARAVPVRLVVAVVAGEAAVAVGIVLGPIGPGPRVAVVIDAIAQLGRSWPGRRDLVITLGTGQIAVSVGVYLVRRWLSVAVLVQAVAELDGAAVATRVEIVAVQAAADFRADPVRVRVAIEPDLERDLHLEVVVLSYLRQHLQSRQEDITQFSGRRQPFEAHLQVHACPGLDPIRRRGAVHRPDRPGGGQSHGLHRHQEQGDITGVAQDDRLDRLARVDRLDLPKVDDSGLEARGGQRLRRVGAAGQQQERDEGGPRPRPPLARRLHGRYSQGPQRTAMSSR